jgi:hypothetical protein
MDDELYPSYPPVMPPRRMPRAPFANRFGAWQTGGRIPLTAPPPWAGAQAYEPEPEGPNEPPSDEEEPSAPPTPPAPAASRPPGRAAPSSLLDMLAPPIANAPFNPWGTGNRRNPRGLGLAQMGLRMMGGGYQGPSLTPPGGWAF